jgi:hypothetical protein
LGADLSAEGAKVWIDEAEINIGDSLIGKISKAISDMDFLLVVLSKSSEKSSWVTQELEQAISEQIRSAKVKVLPVLLEKCAIPTFLIGKLYADFSVPGSYDHQLAMVARSVGLTGGRGGTLFDPSSTKYGRHKSMYARPIAWHCVYCGWKCDQPFNDYICKSCKGIRPFAGGSSTMVECSQCKQLSLALAKHCEWCGSKRISSDNLI